MKRTQHLLLKYSSASVHNRYGLFREVISISKLLINILLDQNKGFTSLAFLINQTDLYYEKIYTIR